MKLKLKYLSLVLAICALPTENSFGAQSQQPLFVTLDGVNIENAQKPPVDFEVLQINSAPVYRNFTVLNHSSRQMKLSSLKVPAAYTLVKNLPSRLKPGGVANFIVTLKTSAPGRFTGQINFRFDNQSFQFPVTGIVKVPQAPLLTPSFSAPVANFTAFAPAYPIPRIVSSLNATQADQTNFKGNHNSDYPSISAYGRYVVFTSTATNLVNGASGKQVYRVDLQNPAAPPQIVSSRDSTEANQTNYQGTACSYSSQPGSVSFCMPPNVYPQVSADGRYVVFESDSTNYVTGASGLQIYRKDMNNPSLPPQIVTSRDSTQADQTNYQGNSGGWGGTRFVYLGGISNDGRYVVFVTTSTNFVTGAAPWQIYRKDMSHPELPPKIVSSLDSTQADQTNYQAINFLNSSSSRVTEFPNMSFDGRFVTFMSPATNFVNGALGLQVYRKDMNNPAQPPVIVSSLDSTQADQTNYQGNDFSQDSSISDDGRYVAFMSRATNFVNGASAFQIYRKDMNNPALPPVIVSSLDSTQANQTNFRASSYTFLPQISSDGRFVVMQSMANNFVTGASGTHQIYVKDMNSPAAAPKILSSSNPTQGDQTNYQATGYSAYPQISDDGQAVFFSSATNLVTGASNLQIYAVTAFEPTCPIDASHGRAWVFANGVMDFNTMQMLPQVEVCLSNLGNYDANGNLIGSNNGRLTGKYGITDINSINSSNSDVEWDPVLPIVSVNNDFRVDYTGATSGLVRESHLWNSEANFYYWVNDWRTKFFTDSFIDQLQLPAAISDNLKLHQFRPDLNLPNAVQVRPTLVVSEAFRAGGINLYPAWNQEWVTTKTRGPYTPFDIEPPMSLIYDQEVTMGDYAGLMAFWMSEANPGFTSDAFFGENDDWKTNVTPALNDGISAWAAYRATGNEEVYKYTSYFYTNFGPHACGAAHPKLLPCAKGRNVRNVKMYEANTIYTDLTFPFSYSPPNVGSFGGPIGSDNSALYFAAIFYDIAHEAGLGINKADLLAWKTISLVSTPASFSMETFGQKVILAARLLFPSTTPVAAPLTPPSSAEAPFLSIYENDIAQVLTSRGIRLYSKSSFQALLPTAIGNTSTLETPSANGFGSSHPESHPGFPYYGSHSIFSKWLYRSLECELYGLSFLQTF